MHITEAPSYLYIRVVIIAPAYASLCKAGNANNLATIINRNTINIDSRPSCFDYFRNPFTRVVCKPLLKEGIKRLVDAFLEQFGVDFFSVEILSFQLSFKLKFC